MPIGSADLLALGSSMVGEGTKSWYVSTATPLATPK